MAVFIMVGVDMALDPTMEQAGQDPGTGLTTICQVHTGNREISSHLHDISCFS